MILRSSAQPVGNTALKNFDALIIGSGAGGSAAAAILTRHGFNVLILEAGPNYFQGLDRTDASQIRTDFSNDVLKQNRRGIIYPNPLVDPRTFRSSEKDGKRKFVGEVNSLAQTLGGAAAHADLKMPRFNPTDFKLGSLLGEIPGADFADWPVDYDMLEPFYYEMEKVLGVQGEVGINPLEGWRSGPYPLPPGAGMYSGLKASEAASKLGYHPFSYAAAVNSRPYQGRPVCNDCGFCTGYVCPISAKGAPPVTTLRNALLTGRCLILPETKVVGLLSNSARNEVTGVEAITPDGEKIVYHADRYVLAASAIESARLLLLSDRSGAGLGNSSGRVGKNLTFHLQNYAVGVFDERLHAHRGRAVSHGMADFRGVPGDPNRPLGGVIEFGGGSDPIDEAVTYAITLKAGGKTLKSLLQQSPLRDRLMSLTMQAEDAPQLTNQVDLDPEIVDLDGIPVARVTYANHAFELGSRKFYSGKMLEIVKTAGARFGFIPPMDSIPSSRHVMGTLRFGKNPETSVCDANGKAHDLGNLYVADSALFPTSSGFNPTLTLMALATRVGAAMVFPQSPEQALSKN